MSKRFYLNEKNDLVMECYPEWGNSVESMYDKLCGKASKSSTLVINHTFYLEKKNLTAESKRILKDDPLQDSIDFVVGKLTRDKEYIALDRSVFHLQFNVFFDPTITLYQHYFSKEGASVIAAISNVAKRDIYIDSNKNYNGYEGHVSLNQFKEMISRMLTNYGISLYKQKMAEEVAGQYFDVNYENTNRYERYIGKQLDIKPYKESLSPEYYSSKIYEYEQILTYLKKALDDNSLPETEWQKAIADVLLLLYPKYLYIFSQFEFKSLGKDKKPDFIAIDNDGNVDVIEIKKASIGKMLRRYRDNYVPSSEISCACVQIEQYIFYMMSNKTEVEKQIKDAYKEIIGDLRINIINPQGILIAGRSGDLLEAEKKDFEVAKRMHKHIYDVLTYDILIERLNNTINAFKAKLKNNK